MRFEIYRERAKGSGLAQGLIPAARTGDWRWRLRAGNNEPIASGEGYARRDDCLRAIDLVMSTDASTDIVEVDD